MKDQAVINYINLNLSVECNYNFLLNFIYFYFFSVLHNNNKSSLNMGYLHNIDVCSGFKVNYSLFYKYDNFVNKLKSCNYLFDKSADYKKVEGQEHLTFGVEVKKNFTDNKFVNSATWKAVVDQKGLKFSKTGNFKGYGDIFDSVNWGIKGNVKLFLIL